MYWNPKSVMAAVFLLHGSFELGQRKYAKDRGSLLEFEKMISSVETRIFLQEIFEYQDILEG